MGDEERRVDLKPALAEVRAALGEQGRILEHLTGKIDKIVDLVTETGKWQAGHHFGYAGRMFRTLFEAGVNIELITTSEIRITCLIDETQIPKAVKALHKAFELEEA